MADHDDTCGHTPTGQPSGLEPERLALLHEAQYQQEALINALLRGAYDGNDVLLWLVRSTCKRLEELSLIVLRVCDTNDSDLDEIRETLGCVEMPPWLMPASSNTPTGAARSPASP